MRNSSVVVYSTVTRLLDNRVHLGWSSHACTSTPVELADLVVWQHMIPYLHYISVSLLQAWSCVTCPGLDLEPKPEQPLVLDADLSLLVGTNVYCVAGILEE